MKTPSYKPAGNDTDLTDEEWALVEPFFFPVGAKRGRGRRREPHAARACFDAIRYILKAGCQWALLPKEFPPRSTVHDAFASWTAEGLWPRINTALRERVRVGTLKKRHAQRRDHRQPERQGRAAPRRQQRLGRGQEDQRTQAPHVDRHQRPAAGRWWSHRRVCRIATVPKCSCASSATAC